MRYLTVYQAQFTMLQRLLFAFACLLFTTSIMSQDYPAEWKKIAQLNQEGKYRSALEAADKIYSLAEQQGDVDEQLKALFHRAAYTGQLEEDGQEALIDFLGNTLSEQSNETFLAVNHFVLARAYFQYLQQARNRGTQEENESTDPETPLAEWSIARIANAGADHLLQSLELAENANVRLNRIPAIVNRGERLEFQRPTLYDVLVYDALNLMNRYSGYLIEPTYAFRPTAELLLAEAGNFKVAKFESNDSSFLFRATLIYQNLLKKYHNDPTNKSTYVYADLQRLNWAYGQRNDEKLLFTRLSDLHSNYQGNEGAGDVLLRLVQLMQQHPELGYTGDPKENKINVRVLKLLEDVQRIYPESLEAYQAGSQIEAIKRPYLRLLTEKVNLPNQHLLVNVNYQNLEELHYRLLPREFSLEDEQENIRTRLANLLKLNPLQSDRIRLGKNDDYANHSTEIALAPLQPGHYDLLVSGSSTFDLTKAPVHAIKIEVSALGMMQLRTEKNDQLLIFNRKTGAAEPQVKATFYRWVGDYRNRKLDKVSAASSNQQGIIKQPGNDRRLFILLEKDGDRAVIPFSSYNNRYQQNKYNQNHILTDRGIYRPGQTVYFKGVMLTFDEEGVPSVRANAKTAIRLRDANYQVVKEVTMTGDQYGSFNGSFELPTGGLNGSFTIETDNGSGSIRVEAYKRPRFEVKFQEEEEDILAGETVSVNGTALGYAGPPVSGATVNFQVIRKPQAFPWYYYRGYQQNQDGEAVMTTGTTTTDDEGNFTVEFTAELPKNTNKNQRFRPGYTFEISVDVADLTGETHAATTSRYVKQQGVSINLTAPNNIDAGTLTEFDINLNYVGGQQPEAKEVTVVIQPVTHPDPGLISRRWQAPDRPTIKQAEFKKMFPLFSYQNAPDVAEWPVAGQQFYERKITISADSTFTVETAGLEVGYYRLEMTYQLDGEEKKAYQSITVVDSKQGKLPTDQLYLYTTPTEQTHPAGSLYARTLITNEPLPMVLTTLVSRGTKSFYQRNTVQQKLVIDHTVKLEDRGGMMESMVFARHNRIFNSSSRINVPWPEKDLQLTYATFRDKLRPGDEESWKIMVTDHEGNPVNSQVLASMYDASLDQILPFNWKGGFGIFPTYYSSNSRLNTFLYQSINGNGLYEPKTKSTQRPGFQIPTLDLGPLQRNFGRSRMMNYSAVSAEADGAVMKRSSPPPPPMAAPASAMMDNDLESGESEALEDSIVEETIANQPTSGEAPVSIRKNLQETAFWFPEIQTDKDGNLILSFSAPEALTRWKLQLFAHTPELEYAFSEKEIVTQKELMILPNAPRFLREGDRIEFTAKVSNLSDKLMAATAYLELFNPETEELISDFNVAAVGEKSNAKGNELGMTLADGESKTVAWSITVPDNSAGLIGYRVVVKAGNISDGEQNVLPVLTNRIFLTAAKPFYVKPGKKQTATLDALKASAASSGNLQHQGFTFELTADPSWLVVKSLPYLMEYPYDCTEQIANRFFANQLSYTIVNGNPALKDVFEAWKKDPDALTSPLALNEDLKQAALEETPWLREAADESEQRERLAVLFDLNKLAAEQEATLTKLIQRQNNDGSFSWFPGGPENRYMTQYVAETMIRLDQLGALNGNNRDQVNAMTAKTFDFLDFKAEQDYERVMKLNTQKEKDEYKPSSMILHYLYVRSTPVKGMNAPEGKAKVAYDYFMQQAEKFWLDYALYEQALLSITFHHAGSQMSKIIMASLRERAIRKDEFGMYWKYPRGYSWQQLPIETHCRIIEAFQVNGASKDELDDMRLYLLQNKRTTRWETTKATAAAAYAFLHTDGDRLKISSGQTVQVSFPDLNKSDFLQQLTSAENTAEAGTGYYRVNWSGDQVTDNFAKVQLKNKGKRIAWGAMYWQYTQGINAVVANNDNPLKLQRKLFRRINTDAGQRLEEITEASPMKPGERLVVKLIINTDRDLEYVHLKDRRAASLEPTEQLSRYKYEGGLGFYFSPDDLAVHYFIDYLPRGTYTVEYDLFVNHAGEFSNGLSVIQSMYAPEFSAYSAGSSLTVER